ncbi:MAG: endonuclease Q family protein [Dictyoglomus sp.]|nr:endonuclease Q family protein [Dictyoglomus sp.]MCX7941532.1 endonuclease Q family protein [Dictyoglomaceae bacterium]MDW8187848.1 endonuclease Q family protein [Dictyoglomus sp.]
MRFIADFHIHSKYSRATSSDMNLENLSKWAKLKGIDLLGTGDFTHPLWFAELRDNLKEDNYGIYKYNEVNFILTTEISNIYNQEGKVRRIHSIIFSPSLEICHKINALLGKIGVLSSDGRPTFGKNLKELLPLLWEISEEIYVIPAHAWTPWFSIFGSNSGFDSLEEAFGEYSNKIFAIETGLSSDPPMNWRLSKLDNICLISNSDAHSPNRLGREANVFNCNMEYREIFKAIKNQDKNRFLFTIEFFPEEGKYHFDGHRNCNIVLSPKESIKLNNLCPSCGKPLTIGVAHRVEVLADREEGYIPENKIPYKNLVPLEEIIAQAINKDVSSPFVQNEYFKIVSTLGNELSVLMDIPLDDIKKVSGEKIAEGIKLMREGKVKVEPGYDGLYGKIKIFSYEDKGQLSLF